MSTEENNNRPNFTYSSQTFQLEMLASFNSKSTINHMKRVVIDSNLTYETDLPVKVGDRVKLPTPDFLEDVKGYSWEGEITSLDSSYTGPCKKILGMGTPKEEVKAKENKKRARMAQFIADYRINGDRYKSAGRWAVWGTKYERQDEKFIGDYSTLEAAQWSGGNNAQSLGANQFAFILNPKGKAEFWADLENRPSKVEWIPFPKKEKNKKLDNDIGIGEMN